MAGAVAGSPALMAQACNEEDLLRWMDAWPLEKGERCLSDVAAWIAPLWTFHPPAKRYRRPPVPDTISQSRRVAEWKRFPYRTKATISG